MLQAMAVVGLHEPILDDERQAKAEIPAATADPPPRRDRRHATRRSVGKTDALGCGYIVGLMRARANRPGPVARDIDAILQSRR